MLKQVAELTDNHSNGNNTASPKPFALTFNDRNESNMNIDGIDPSQIDGLRTPFLETQAQAPIQAPKPEEAKAETEKVAQLAEQARDLPENRPDMVERGKELLADPNYPSPQVEEQVARILLGLDEEAF